MPLSYQQVMNADLAQLKKVADEWRGLPGQLTSVRVDFKTSVADSLTESSWRGSSAKAARKAFKKITEEFNRANEEAGGVALLLSNAHHALLSVQKQLKVISAEIKESKHLTLTTNGEVIFDSPEQDPDERLRIQGQYKETIPEYNQRIKSLIRKASETDEALAWVLAQDGNGRSAGFNAQQYYSINDAAKGREEAEKDAKTSEKILESGTDATDEELTRLNAIASAREGDPYFSEKVATRVGPKKILEFWAMAGHSNLGQERTTILKKVQKTLGVALATATHSDSKEMKTWKKEMIKYGSEYISTPEPHGSTRVVVPPLGYQVMSPLLRNGDYDADFLTDYTHSALKFERDNGGPAIWNQAMVGYRLDLENNGGTDPFAGIMHGLGNNPEAAQNVLSKKGDLEYFMKDREWGEFVTDTGIIQKPPHDDLGRALQSATLGVPADEPGLNRSKESSQIFERIVQFVADDEDYLSERQGLEDGIARIGAGYIDDLTRASSDAGGDSGRVFDPENEKNNVRKINSLFGYKNEENADIPPMAAHAFLAQLGRDASAHETLMAAQQVYTIGALEKNAETALEAKIIQNSAAYNHGMLDAARTSEIRNLHKESVEDAEHDLVKTTNWTKWSMSATVGLAAGVITVGLGGSGAAAVTVPLAMEVASGAYDTFLDNGKEDKVKNADFGGADDTEAAIQKYIHYGREVVEVPAQNWSDRSEISAEERMDLNSEAKNAYMRAYRVSDSLEGVE